jgi:hypothetical protein
MSIVRRVVGTWHGHCLILFGFLSQNIEDESSGRGVQCGACPNVSAG